MNIKQILQEKREEILAITAKHGAYNVRVFGSVARGDATDDSDVDFLVEIEPDRNLLDRIALIQDLEELLKRKVDVVKIENLYEHIRDRILKEAINL
jgi:predicted nucleotidyltransferase